MDSWFFPREPVNVEPVLLLNAQQQVVKTSIFKPYENPPYFQDARLKAFIYDSHNQSYHLNSDDYRVVHFTPKRVIPEQEIVRYIENGGMQKPVQQLAQNFGIPEGPVPLYLIVFHAFHDSIFIQKEDLDSCSLYDFMCETVKNKTGFQKLAESLYTFTRPEANMLHQCKTEELVRCSDNVLFCKTCCMLKAPLPAIPGTAATYRAKTIGKVILPDRALIEFIKRIERELTVTTSTKYGLRTKAREVDVKVVIFPHFDELLKTRMVENFPSVDPHILVAVVMRYCVFMAPTKTKKMRSWEEVQRERNKFKNTAANAATIASGLSAIFQISVAIAGLV